MCASVRVHICVGVCACACVFRNRADPFPCGMRTLPLLCSWVVFLKFQNHRVVLSIVWAQSSRALALSRILLMCLGSRLSVSLVSAILFALIRYLHVIFCFCRVTGPRFGPVSEISQGLANYILVVVLQ